MSDIKPTRKQISRLHADAVFMGYRRGKTTQHEGQAIVKVDGLKSRKDTSFYVGKRVCYVYSAKPKKTTKPITEGDKPLSRTRCIWGKVIAPHGNSGALRAKFKTNLPPKAIGGKLRVMLYPSFI